MTATVDNLPGVTWYPIRPEDSIHLGWLLVNLDLQVPFSVDMRRSDFTGLKVAIHLGQDDAPRDERVAAVYAAAAQNGTRARTVHEHVEARWSTAEGEVVVTTPTVTVEVDEEPEWADRNYEHWTDSIRDEAAEVGR